MRQRGQFKKVPGIFERKAAILEGRKKVETSAAASFKVVPEGGARPINIGNEVPSSVYYGSKREAGVFIQKAFKRISSSGEKREITQKGIAANRASGIFKRQKRGRR